MRGFIQPYFGGIGRLWRRVSRHVWRRGRCAAMPSPWVPGAQPVGVPRITSIHVYIYTYIYIYADVDVYISVYIYI